ncbi:hypothetical protein [Motilimonas eburnea]|uniref:hypothetical protein n=1 Tax=Motilimonas eburnea TaxID=1737488 RepID=UPI001E425E4F|nr:hypothetical protein [Motilimonas eburnea]MCE2572719.1 hypothetical protein [Motilimonas eburnea]
MRNILFATGMSLVLAACGGSGSNSDLRAKEASLVNISGVWDASELIDDKQDEFYVVIKDHGEISFYDYMGDEYDNLDNCYQNVSYSLTDLGDDLFEMVTNLSVVSNIKAQLDGDRLVLTRNDESQTLIKSNRLESSFSPLCITDFGQSVRTSLFTQQD